MSDTPPPVGLEELGIQLPTSAGPVEQGPGPIGVPDTYAAPGWDLGPKPFSRMTTSGHQYSRVGRDLTPPRYFEGDDWLPATWSAERIAGFQRQLDAAGVFKKGTRYRLGVWDDASRQAYRDLLTHANASGLTEQESLRRWQQSQDDTGGKMVAAGTGGKLVSTGLDEALPENPANIRALADKTAVGVLGRKLSEAEQGRFEQAWRQMEEEVALGDVAAPDAGVFAETQVQAASPQEATGYSAANRAMEFFDMLESPVNVGTNA